MTCKDCGYWKLRIGRQGDCYVNPPTCLVDGDACTDVRPSTYENDPACRFFTWRPTDGTEHL